MTTTLPGSSTCVFTTKPLPSFLRVARGGPRLLKFDLNPNAVARFQTTLHAQATCRWSMAFSTAALSFGASTGLMR